MHNGILMRCQIYLPTIFNAYLFKIDFYVGLLDTASLCTVIYVEVRLLTFRSPQTLRKRDQHCELLLFYVGILDIASLCAVIYVEVRLPTSGSHSPQTPHKRDPHWESLLFVFVVVVVAVF